MSTPSNATPSPQPSPTPVAPPVVKATDSKASIVAKPVEKATLIDSETWDVQEDGRTVKKSKKELIDAYQLRQLSDKKRSEAEKTMAEYTKLFNHLNQDPVKFLRAAGIDFDKLSTSYLAKKAEESMLDPKDRELKQAKAEAEQYKKWVQEQKTAQEKATQDAAISQERTKLHQEVIQAIEEAKDLGMPVDEELIIAVAQKMILQDKKQKPLNAKEALPQAYASTQKWLQGMASKMEGEALVKWLGEDVSRKIRKYDLGKLKASRAQTAPQPGNSSVKSQEQKKEAPKKAYRTWSEFKAETLDKIQ